MYTEFLSLRQSADKFVNIKAFTTAKVFSLRVILSGIKMGVNTVFTLLLTGKHNWSIS